MTRPYELLIFDWDGTLADSEALIVGSMQTAIRALALPARSDAQIRELIGLGLNEGLQILYPDLDVPALRRLLDGYRAQFVGSGHNEAPLFDGVLETLRALHQEGYGLCIATGKSRKGLDRSLAHHHELAPLFLATRTADETASKPDPQMLEELLWETGVEAARALMIGDTEYDVAMAAALGIDAVAVTCGVHDAQRLLNAGAKGLIEQTRQLPGWLTR